MAYNILFFASKRKSDVVQRVPDITWTLDEELQNAWNTRKHDPRLKAMEE
jgi:hypothetical protein